MVGSTVPEVVGAGDVVVVLDRNAGDDDNDDDDDLVADSLMSFVSKQQRLA